MKNSCLYECTVMHHRLEPVKNKFHYKLFMFCLDLDEINAVVKSNLFISRNRFNLFNFRDRDHLQLPGVDHTASVKAHVLEYLKDNKCDVNSISRIMLVTNLCTLGYQFNPVSFYFCFDRADKPVCSVAEVGNTYGEMKLYFLGNETFQENNFSSRTAKNFYVSPFIDMDADFQFRLAVPSERLSIHINDHKKGRKLFLSTLTGTRKPLTSLSALRYAIRFPFITLQIIFLIHWQAMKLWMCKINYHKKSSFIDLQQKVLKPHKSIID